tara:strand:- start:2247 stop:2435 length:189 start_codon:yes stop_codon:yes gene_type:complete
MANTIIQNVQQIGFDEIPERIVIISKNDSEEETSTIVNYDNLTTEQKATFDSFNSLCITLIQ